MRGKAGHKHVGGRGGWEEEEQGLRGREQRIEEQRARKQMIYLFRMGLWTRSNAQGLGGESGIKKHNILGDSGEARGRQVVSSILPLHSRCYKHLPL